MKRIDVTDFMYSNNDECVEVFECKCGELFDVPTIFPQVYALGGNNFTCPKCMSEFKAEIRVFFIVPSEAPNETN